MIDFTQQEKKFLRWLLEQSAIRIESRIKNIDDRKKKQDSESKEKSRTWYNRIRGKTVSPRYDVSDEMQSNFLPSYRDIINRILKKLVNSK